MRKSIDPGPRARLPLYMDDMKVGQAVELMGVENAGLDITGKRGTVTEIQRHGLVTVAIDGSDAVISVWPDNLSIVRSSDVKQTTDSAAAAKSEPAT
jgi:hypothetical protein